MDPFARIARRSFLDLAAKRRPPRSWPLLEMLEGRCLLASSFTQTNLVSDTPGLAKTTDPNLVNPWGIALGLNSPFWIANNHTGTATVYDGNGQQIPSAAAPLVVNIPAPGGGTGTPTGEVSNATSGFVVSAGGTSAPSSFLFATEDGTIIGWSGSVDRTHAIIAVDNSASGAVYKGLAQGFNATGAYLYATNFHAGTVDVFDQNFNPVHIPGAFTDSGIPAGYAPFGIQAINGNLYVTYAMQDAAKHDDVAGAGHGFVDVFDTQGTLLKRFTSQGQLDSPWGMAWAPINSYGDFSNALLVGNFGDGTIDAYDFDSGAFLGKLSDATGKPITDPGLWGLSFGDGAASTSPNTLYFTSGPGGEAHGLFGDLTLDPTTTPPPGPVMTDPNLTVTTVVSGLNQPTNMTFLGPDDFIVLEKATGKIQHVVNGTLATPVQFVTPAGVTLPNLPVNNASERGTAGHRPRPELRDQPRRLSLLDREQHGRSLQRPVPGRQPHVGLPAGHGPTAGKPGGSIRL